MPLRQPYPSLVAHQVAVKVTRRREAQRPKQQKLTRCRFQQIGPAHNFRDAHAGIVDHHRQLISRHIVAPPNDEVAEVPTRHKSLRPEMPVVKTNLLAIRNPKPPIRSRRL